MSFITMLRAWMFYVIFSAFLASQVCFADQGPSNVVLHYTHDYACDPGFPSFDHSALSFRIIQLQKIKEWNAGSPKLANIYGISYTGTLNNQFSYSGLNQIYAYHLIPGVELTPGGLGFANAIEATWLSVDSYDKIQWTGTLHLQSGDKRCTLDFAN